MAQPDVLARGDTTQEASASPWPYSWSFLDPKLALLELERDNCMAGVLCKATLCGYQCGWWASPVLSVAGLVTAAATAAFSLATL